MRGPALALALAAVSGCAAAPVSQECLEYREARQQLEEAYGDAPPGGRQAYLLDAIRNLEEEACR